eukprot:139328_1
MLFLFLVIQSVFSCNVEYESDGSTYWRSLSASFKPIQNGSLSSCGDILIQKSMYMEFDMIFHGKTNWTQYESVLRVGLENNFCGEPGHPSLFIVDTSESIKVAIENEQDCWGVLMNSGYLIERNILYSIIIHYNETWTFISLNDIIIYNNAPKHTQNRRLGSLASILFGGVTDDNGIQYPSADVTLSNMLIISYNYELNITQFKRSNNAPTIDKSTTNEPTLFPVLKYNSTEIVRSQTETTPFQTTMITEDQINLELLFRYICGGMIIIISVIILVGFFHAKRIKINDFFNLKYCVMAAIQFYDILSDCFVAIKISTFIDTDYDHYKCLEDPFLIMLLISVCCIVIPVILSVAQLFHHSHKYWITNYRLSAWFANNALWLYTLSFITGSSFSAVSMLNSHLFSLDLFSMGLSQRNIGYFHTKRVYSIVLIENIPQAAINSWFLISVGDIQHNYIAIISLVFSLISIIVTILSFMQQRKIFESQVCVEINMDVMGGFDVDECQTRVNDLESYFAKNVFVEVHEQLIEIMKPNNIQNGLQITLELYFDSNYVDDDKLQHFVEKLDKMKQNNKLAETIQKCWNLQDLPTVDNIKVELVGMHKMIQKLQMPIQLNVVPKNTITEYDLDENDTDENIKL